MSCFIITASKHKANSWCWTYRHNASYLHYLQIHDPQTRWFSSSPQATLCKLHIFLPASFLIISSWDKQTRLNSWDSNLLQTRNIEWTYSHLNSQLQRKFNIGLNLSSCEAKCRDRVKHSDGAEKRFSRILMTARWDRRDLGGRQRGLESREVSRFGETEPSTCLFKRKERRDGETDGRKDGLVYSPSAQ